MRFVMHHPVKVDRKWRYCVRHPSTPHQMESSSLASRPGRFIPGKELPIPLEREAQSSLGPVCWLQRRGNTLAIPGIPPRPSSTAQYLWLHQFTNSNINTLPLQPVVSVFCSNATTTIKYVLCISMQITAVCETSSPYHHTLPVITRLYVTTR